MVRPTLRRRSSRREAPESCSALPANLLWVRTGVEANPQSFWAERILIAAAVHAGARGEARRIARRLLRKDPDLTVSEARRAWPFRPPFMARLCDGLETAGIPRT